jgi:hypothetical protein
MIVEIGKGVQQGLLYGFLPRSKPRAVSMGVPRVAEGPEEEVRD